MVQAVWSTAHGHPLRSRTSPASRSRGSASHFDPILVLFAPLWWLWPSPELLLVVAGDRDRARRAAGLLARAEHLDSEPAGLGFALAYLLYPRDEWLTLNEFHPVALATPAASLRVLVPRRGPPPAVRRLSRRSRCATKEEIGLVVAGLGSGTRWPPPAGRGDRDRRSRACRRAIAIAS